MKTKVTVLVICIVAFIVSIISLFGETVGVKYHEANSVVSAVSFDDYAGGGYPAPARSVEWQSAPVVQPQPQALPMKSTEQEALSTFALDVDTASFSKARGDILRGYLPGSNTVRVEEWLNYFDAQVPVEKGETFGLRLEAAPSPLSAEPDTMMVRIALKAMTPEVRKPWRLTFLVDVSGSMENNLPLAKHSMKQIVSQMKKGDVVNLVTYAGSNRIILRGGQNPSEIIRAIDTLSSGGGTAMGSGMELAYDVAIKSQKQNAINRVIVFTDGDTNIGNTSHDGILATVRSKVEDGISLMAVGYGASQYNDYLMEELSNAGDGKYVFIDSELESKKVFQKNILRWMQDVATEARAQVEFNPETVKSWKQIGYENRQMDHSDFRNDQKDAGEVGAGHSVTALYEVKLTSKQGRIAHVRLRYQKNGAAEERAWTLDGSEIHTRLGNASQDFQFFAAVAGAATLLQHPDANIPITWTLIRELAQHSAHTEDQQEFVELLGKINRLNVQ